MDFESEQGRPVLAAATPSASASTFDPMRLEGAQPGEGGDRLVFERYQPRLQRFFQRKGVPSEEAKDLTQETFLRVFRSEARPADALELEAWLFEISRNVYRNWWRARVAQKRAATVISLDEPGADGKAIQVEDPDIAAGATDALAGAITREQLDLLRRALAELPAQMRQCTSLRIKDDLKYREIAQAMGISIETVKSHLHQAKQHLRTRLERIFGPIDW